MSNNSYSKFQSALAVHEKCEPQVSWLRRASLSAKESLRLVFVVSFSLVRFFWTSKRNEQLILTLGALILLSSCDDSIPETTTSGKVKIIVDESYSLLFDTEAYVFKSLYKYSDIHFSYKPEADALQSLMNDCCKVVVTNRSLTEQELKNFEAANIYPKSIKIAEDAVAFIINKENKDTALTVDQVKNILKGTETSWKNINKESPLEQIAVVFDNKGSANARYAKDIILEGKELGKNCFTVNSNSEVMSYVESNKNALGVVSVNWLSDKHDSITQHFLARVKVVGIKQNADAYPFRPYQAYIKSKEYPFCRDVYMINRQTTAGLGTGFVSFVAGEKGQRIILKSGLIPSTMPTREIKINTNFDPNN